MVVAPRPGLFARKSPQVKDVKVVWIPAIDGLLFDEYLTSIFSPSRIEKKLEKEGLDVIIFTTPGQISLLGAYVAKRMNIPLIQQYSTDIVMYVNHYKSAIPAMFALSLAAPFVLKLKLSEIASITKSLAKKSDKSLTLRQETVAKLLVTIHNACDGIIAVSEKSAEQLKKYKEIKTPIYVLPTGVDALPLAKKYSRKYFKIPDNNIVFLNTGRVTKEKNLELLIESFEQVCKKQKNCVLLIAGDSSYRPILERKARNLNNKNIIFTGKIKREYLADIYALSDIFVFPSLTDTQGLVLNEAAHSGLPFVWCDELVNAVVKNNYNGLLAKPNKQSFSKAMLKLANDSSTRQKMSVNSKFLADKFSEINQTKELAKIIKSFK